MKAPGSPQVWTPDDLKIARNSLGEGIARWTVKNGRLITAIPALSLRQWESPTELSSYMHEPSLCLVAQGAKRVLLGKESYTYDAYHFLITAVDLPVVSQIIEASREKPFLGLVLRLDRRSIAQMMVDRDVPLPSPQQASRGMKNALLGGKVIRSKPELEECREIARRHGIPLADVYACIGRHTKERTG